MSFDRENHSDGICEITSQDPTACPQRRRNGDQDNRLTVRCCDDLFVCQTFIILLPTMSSSYNVNDPVSVILSNKKHEGVVAFIDDDRYGIRLTGSSVGAGVHDGEGKFPAPPNSGVWAKASDLAPRKLTRLEELRLRRELASSGPPSGTGAAASSSSSAGAAVTATPSASRSAATSGLTTPRASRIAASSSTPAPSSSTSAEARQRLEGKENLSPRVPF